MTGKYDRPADRLAAIGAAEITMTFVEIEAVSGPLPSAARGNNAQWWGVTAQVPL